MIKTFCDRCGVYVNPVTQWHINASRVKVPLKDDPLEGYHT